MHKISEISQKNLYVGKSGFLGPNIINSNIKSFAKNAINPVIKTAKKDLIICHLKISRCSKNDISLSPDTSTQKFLLNPIYAQHQYSYYFYPSKSYDLWIYSLFLLRHDQLTYFHRIRLDFYS